MVGPYRVNGRGDDCEECNYVEGGIQEEERNTTAIWQDAVIVYLIDKYIIECSIKAVNRNERGKINYKAIRLNNLCYIY